MPILNDNRSEQTLSVIVEINRLDLAKLREMTGIVDMGQLAQYVFDSAIAGFFFEEESCDGGYGRMIA